MNSNEKVSTNMLPGFSPLDVSGRENEVESTQQQTTETIPQRGKTIKRIDFIKYRKLENISFDFTSEVNIISGVNGTCKSSLLHLISNAFQRPTAKEQELKKCLRTLRAINAGVNHKIEALARESKKYQDPAKEIKGTLFEITYANDLKLKFRRHNSEEINRFCLKPQYPHGKEEKLPAIPIIYLGLSRLYPIGEFQKNDEIENIEAKLPTTYRDEIKNMYKDLVNIEIEDLQPQRMKGIKVRNDFSSTLNEIDGNTISSGEDNVFIILTALYSLKYYYETLPESEKEQGSILLIDEFDATLHPSLQNRFLDIIRDFSRQYKIQVVVTTHSLSLLEHAFRKKDHVIYLCDNIESVYAMDNPDIYKIEMKLRNISRESFYEDREIPIFTEDEEARMFMDYYLKHLQTTDHNFAYIASRFHFVNANFGSGELSKLFKDEKFQKILHGICILDGDSTQQLVENMIALPGKKPPERVIFDYAETIYNDPNHPFWSSEEADKNNYDRFFYREHIQREYKEALNGASARTALKSLWNRYKSFVALILKTWLNDPANYGEIMHFTSAFHHLFFNTAEFHGLNKRDWPERNQGKEQS